MSENVIEAQVIEVQDLVKRYNGRAVVDRVSFGIAPGEIFGLLGPNGAGKTTTILMLLGLTEITSGTARVLGHDPQREPLAVKRGVGYLPDAVGFYDYLSAVDNLRYTARLMGIPPAERQRRIVDALARVGLSAVADKPVSTYSRGMRQRLGLAEILMKDARIAILDEPTSGLDPRATADLLDIIRDFKRNGVAVLVSSHLLQQVQSVCDRVALFQGGRIALMGTVEELGRQVLGGGYTVIIEAQGAGLRDRLARIPGVSNIEEDAPGHIRILADRDVRAEAAAEIAGAGGRLLRLDAETPSLETIYGRYFHNLAAQGGQAHAA